MYNADKFVMELGKLTPADTVVGPALKPVMVEMVPEDLKYLASVMQALATGRWAQNERIYQACVAALEKIGQ